MKKLFVFALLLTASLGCSHVAQLTNLNDPSCGKTFADQLTTVLVAQGEKPETAGELVERTSRILERGRFGPRPFLVASPSGTDYTFFVEPKKKGCLLRLYGRQKGFVSYTNNLTYIDTKPLPGCLCSE